MKKASKKPKKVPRKAVMRPRKEAVKPAEPKQEPVEEKAEPPKEEAKTEKAEAKTEQKPVEEEFHYRRESSLSRLLDRFGHISVHPSRDMVGWIGFLLLALAFMLPVMQLFGTTMPQSPSTMISEIGSRVGFGNFYSVFYFLRSSQFPFLYLSFLLLPIAVIISLAGLLLDNHDLRLLSAILGATYPVFFFQIVPGFILLSFTLLTASLGVYCAALGSAILFYRSARKKLSKRFWLAAVIILASFALFYYNPAILSQPSVPSGGVGETSAFSGCPFENDLKELLSSSANTSAVISTGRIGLPCGDLVPSFVSNKSKIDDNYRFGYATSCLNGQCVCSSPSTNTYDVYCRRGELEGENINYLYCYGFMSEIPGYLIANETVNPDGTIGKKYRYLITALVLDSRDNQVKNLKCEQISCYGE